MVTDPQEFDESGQPSGEGGVPADEGGVEERNLEEREVQVVGVFEHGDQAPGAFTNPFVLIRDAQQRCVLIWVGRFEAIAISMALEGASADRPLTHDLLKNVTEKLGAHIERIVIDDLWGETFYAKLWLGVGTESLTVDSRPSDAIALALRVRCPIFMTEAVLLEASRPCEELEGDTEPEGE